MQHQKLMTSYFYSFALTSKMVSLNRQMPDFSLIHQTTLTSTTTMKSNQVNLLLLFNPFQEFAWPLKHITNTQAARALREENA